LSQISAVLGGHPTRMPGCRLRLDAILMECVIGEKDRASQQLRNTPFGEDRLSMSAKSQLKLEVVFRQQRRVLTARSNCSVWYDFEEMGTNFVVVQARKLAGSAEVIPQCVAYMGRPFLCCISSLRSKHRVEDF
jgi:hypothetical protein